MKILHILYQSYPHQFGSSTRSRDIVTTQKRLGMEVVVLTSPFQRPVEPGKSVEWIDDIPYYRTYSGRQKEEIKDGGGGFFTKIRKMFRIIRFTREMAAIIREEKPDILHAHAMFFCGLPAVLLGWRFRIPVVYEVRSMWVERQRMSQQNFFARAVSGIARIPERFTIKRADQLVAINENLADELKHVSRPGQSVTVAPNSINIKKIDDLRDKVETGGERPLTFGYIGSITPIEGLPLLLEAMVKLKELKSDVALLIFGGGSEQLIGELESYIKVNGLESVYLKGNIDPPNIHEAYAKIDVIVNPRVKSKLTDSVTPLKPLEGMAYKKLVVASDVGGMKELIRNNETGLLFRADDADDLQKTLIRVMDMKDRSEIVENGYNFVKANKSWEKNCKIYEGLYKGMLLSD